MPNGKQNKAAQEWIGSLKLMKIESWMASNAELTRTVYKQENPKSWSLTNALKNAFDNSFFRSYHADVCQFRIYKKGFKPFLT